ncbi:MAG: hypothetical protein ACK6BG_03140, partial [Cyanobacteriota bacterium]
MLGALHRRWRHHRASRRCRPQLRRLRLLVLDVDGVLSDGGLWTPEAGEVIKRFDVRDGRGLRAAGRSGPLERLARLDQDQWQALAAWRGLTHQAFAARPLAPEVC